MECTKKVNIYTYCTYPQVYFNTLDYCYYQFMDIEKRKFNTKRYKSIEQLNSKYYSCYVHETNENVVSIRFSLFKSKMSLERYSNEYIISGKILSTIFLQLIEAIFVLHQNDCYHGNISKNTIFYDRKENTIALSSFKGLDEENDSYLMMLKDQDDIKRVIIGMIHEMNDKDEDEIDTIIEELRDNNNERIEWLKQRTGPFFVAIFLFYLHTENFTIHQIEQLMFLNDIVVNKYHLFESIIMKYIEWYYTQSDIQMKLSPFKKEKKQKLLTMTNINEYFTCLISLNLSSISHNCYYQISIPKTHEFKLYNIPVSSYRQSMFSKDQISIVNEISYNLNNNLNKFINTYSNNSSKLNQKSSKLVPNELSQEMMKEIIQEEKQQNEETIKIKDIDLKTKEKKQSIHIHQKRKQPQITLYCRNSFRLLGAASKLRSIGCFVKCQMKSDDETESDNFMYHITILTIQERFHNINYGDLQCKVRYNNETRFFSLKEFIKHLTNETINSNENNYLSLSMVQYCRMIKDENIIKKGNRQIRNISSNKDIRIIRTPIEKKPVQRVLSCQIVDDD